MDHEAAVPTTLHPPSDGALLGGSTHQHQPNIGTVRLLSIAFFATAVLLMESIPRAAEAKAKVKAKSCTHSVVISIMGQLELDARLSWPFAQSHHRGD
jgi:hypothetical protein